MNQIKNVTSKFMLEMYIKYKVKLKLFSISGSSEASTRPIANRGVQHRRFLELHEFGDLQHDHKFEEQRVRTTSTSRRQSGHELLKRLIYNLSFDFS